MQPDDTKRPDLRDIVYNIGNTLAGLDPGPLAELRRMNPANPTAPMFWRFVSRFKLQNETKWAQIIQLMAILTEKGRDEKKQSPHNYNYSFGASLCDSAEDGWNKEKSREMMSELRFACLLAAKGDMRAKLLFPAVRMLARKKSHGVNCIDLALFLLSDDPRHGHKLARDYYACLDRAQMIDKNSGEDK